MELSDLVGTDEQLYRVMKRSKPEFITDDKVISPALFKDSKGVSVDRDGGRTPDEIIRFIVEETFAKRAKAIVTVSAGFCFEIKAEVEAAPSDANPFHANIWLDKTNEQKRNLQALMLADQCEVVYFNEEIEWV